ncbi:MAG: hypothetical protein HQL96_02325 [Magnetococcales bacterium]|nr:hypothetical protein [Magnetococcales bacterium]
MTSRLQRGINNQIQVYRFQDWDQFWGTVATCSADHQCTQVQYLGRYLRMMKAETLVVESHYIDRHYMDEFASYYARKRGAPPNYCQRVHLFSETMEGERSFDDRLREAASDEKGLERVQQELNDCYLGYIVIRPVDNAPIGRTVLRPWHDKPERHFPTSVEYVVHLAGLRLKINGLAFQQQDQAVAACATTAVWSALQCICRRDGGHAPTPSAITEAAVRHLLVGGRPYPSEGLTVEQISESLRQYGYAPVLFRVADPPQEFQFLLNIYLRSGIPVILGLHKTGDNHIGHAVTVVGYEAKGEFLGLGQINADFMNVVSANLASDKIYIHDDRLGPYARARLQVTDKDLALTMELPNGADESWKIGIGIVPLYEKMRATGEELFKEAAGRGLPFIKLITVPKSTPIGLTLFFQRAGEYQQSLFRSALDAERLTRFQKNAALSRYVGIARWSVNGRTIMDTAWDTTDRIKISGGSFIGAVCYDAVHYKHADWLADHWNGIAG